MTADSAQDDETAGVSELQDLLLGTQSMEEFLQEVAVLAARRVTSGLSCGITMRPSGRPLTVASSDKLAAQLDEVQYGLDMGPCLHAMRTGVLVSVVDTVAESRWAGFGARAAAYGVGSSLSLPLAADRNYVGALNLYAPAARAFGEAALRRAESFAASTSGALALAVRQAHQADLTQQLRAALASRAVIDQAIGIIMAQERCTPDRAFEILRTASQNRNVKLREVAMGIVTSIGGQRPQPPPFTDS